MSEILFILRFAIVQATAGIKIGCNFVPTQWYESVSFMFLPLFIVFISSLKDEGVVFLPDVQQLCSISRYKRWNKKDNLVFVRPSRSHVGFRDSKLKTQLTDGKECHKQNHCIRNVKHHDNFLKMRVSPTIFKLSFVSWFILLIFQCSSLASLNNFYQVPGTGPKTFLFGVIARHMVGISGFFLSFFSSFGMRNTIPSFRNSDVFPTFFS